jgi:hypothetical protein
VQAKSHAQDIERLRESRTTGYAAGLAANRESKTYVLETRNRYAVLESEVSGLPALRGYLKSGNCIVPLTLDYWDLPKKHEGFMPRELGPMFPALAEPPAEDAITATCCRKPSHGPARPGPRAIPATMASTVSRRPWREAPGARHTIMTTSATGLC